MYYLHMNGQNIGPMSAAQVMSYNVNEQTKVSQDGGEWRELINYPELMEELQRKRKNYVDTDSKRVVCGILAILVGTLGIQYFLVGKTAGGIYTILLSIVTCGFWSIITFIQGIMMLCMSDQEFRAKYVDNPASFPIF